VSEQIGVVLVFLGLFLLLGGLFVGAVRGVGVLFRRAPPRRLLGPLALCAIGLAVGAAPLVAQRVWIAVVGLGPRERVVDGRRAITLTGWDRTDYGFLRSRPDVEILEIANPDVTDDTIEILRDLPRLRELTVNDSQVGDAGLAVLRSFPELVTLRAARTKISADGVRGFLGDPPPRLEQIDVSGNGIPAAPLRSWRNAAPPGVERRYLN